MIPVTVIGAGPAGITAAIQLKRSGIKFRFLEKNSIGGLLNEANLVENFPGIPNGVSGRALTARMQRQLSAAGINVEKTQVLHLAYHKGYFMVHTERQIIMTEKVILACGTLPIPPGAPLDQIQLQDRIHNSVLPLLNTRQKTIAVIGGGDAAFDYALNLARKNTVHILIRSAKPRALPLLLHRCRQHPNIVIHENFCLKQAINKEKAAEIVLKTFNSHNGQKNEIVCHQILTAIGRAPALNFLDQNLHLAVKKLEKQNKLFFAGDVSNGRFRQAIIAAAAGLHAAMEIRTGEIK